MGTRGTDAGPATTGLTERQRKWFASVQASLERDTGKTLDEWVAISRTCPHEKPKARADWLRENHGLGINRAAHVLSVAFPSEMRWDEPGKLREALWKDTGSLAILQALEAAIAANLTDVVIGQRKQFTAFSRKVQFAAARPAKGGAVVLGIAVPVEADARLGDRKSSEAWSERNKGQLALALPADIDASIVALLRQAWERS